MYSKSCTIPHDIYLLDNKGLSLRGGAPCEFFCPLLPAIRRDFGNLLATLFQ
jgi:hypothetical protein